MVRYRRNFVPGGMFFFTLTLNNRQSSALVDHVALLRAAFRETRSERPFAVDAIVILPDHLHAIMTLPPGDSDFSGRWQRIKGRFTRSVVAAGMPVSRNKRGEYALWQRRFWEHTIRDDADFERCADYIHFNPVKHRLVMSPGAWPLSSLHRYVQAGVLPSDWGGDGRAHDANFGERGE
jgi:putative transposase